MYSESDIKGSYFYVNGGSKKGSRLTVEEKIKLKDKEDKYPF